MIRCVFAFLLMATVANAGGTPGTYVSPSGRAYTITAPDRDGDMMVLPNDGRGGVGFYSPPRQQRATRYERVSDGRGGYYMSNKAQYLRRK